MTESPVSDASSSAAGGMWEVQDILAQRQSLTGEIELLVVWRSTWIAADQVIDGPVLRHWRAASKFKTAGPMAITLPVDRGTLLFRDCRHIALQRAAQKEAVQSLVGGEVVASTNVLAPDLVPLRVAGPRMQLDSVAKRKRRD
jgi:hypothetical protein